jgi:hypothetical protein
MAVARCFNRISEAAEYCASIGLKDVYIVMGPLGTDGRFDSAFKTVIRPPRTSLTSSAPTKLARDFVN